jgi:hypothetical protein
LFPELRRRNDEFLFPELRRRNDEFLIPELRRRDNEFLFPELRRLNNEFLFPELRRLNNEFLFPQLRRRNASLATVWFQKDAATTHAAGHMENMAFYPNTATFYGQPLRFFDMWFLFIGIFKKNGKQAELNKVSKERFYEEIYSLAPHIRIISRMLSADN